MISTTIHNFDNLRRLNADGLEIGLLTSPANKVLRVAPFGADFQTLTQAKNFAQSGDLIIVMPGTYVENDLLKNGVNWYFMPGAIVNFTATATTIATFQQPAIFDTIPNDNTSVIYGIFDDQSSGACTCKIGGHGSFFVTNNGVMKLLGALVVTNSLSNISFTCNDIGMAMYGDPGTMTSNGSRSPIYVKNATRVDVNVQTKIYGSRGSTFNTGKLDTLSGPIIWNANESGIYWELGPFYIRTGTIENVSSYSVWGNQPVSNTTPADMWLTADFIQNHIYMDGGADGSGHVGVYTWRSWIIVKELGDGPAYFDYGRHYLFCEKMDLTSSSIAISGATQVWITCQKITNNGAGGWFLCSAGNPSGTGCGVVYADIYQCEDTQGSFSAAGFNIGGATTEFHLRGVHAKTAANTPGVLHSAGKVRLSNCIFEMTNNIATANPVKVASAGLILDNCTLISGALANCVTSAAAQTITNYGSRATQAKNANITVNVNAITVDANVV